MPVTTPARSRSSQLQITLLDIAPPIWRRVQVPSKLPLCCLHDVIQISMGWTDSHLHQFEKEGRYWGVPEWDEFGDLDLRDEKMLTVAGVLLAEGDVLVYEYDFGDGWKHEIVLEKIAPPDGSTKPVCLDGARRCPPEDVDGPHGYQEFLEAVFDPEHEDFERYRTWAGNPVHAEEFSAEKANRKLTRLKWPRKHRR